MFNPQGFLTCTKQEISRNNKWKLDTLAIDVSVEDKAGGKKDDKKVDESLFVLVSNLTIEGCVLNKNGLNEAIDRMANICPTMKVTFKEIDKDKAKSADKQKEIVNIPI